MKQTENFRYGVIYQLIVLAALVLFIAWGFWETKEFNEILLGALLGVMVGLPFKENEQNKG